jgi:polyisoprenoid-binding protein YceI
MSLAKDPAQTVRSPVTATPALVSRWDIDPSHAIAQFGVRHMMISTVRGAFEKVSGHVALDEADLTRSTVEIDIDAASVASREPKRDAHLRSADFFDVENHPMITFRSTRIEAAGAGQYRVTGDLTIRSITKSTTLLVNGPTAPQKAPWGAIARGVLATGKVNRKDFGLNWNAVIEAGGFVVGDEVELTFEAELVPAKADEVPAAH